MATMEPQQARHRGEIRRATGAALAVAGVVAGALATVLISRPEWAFVASLLMAVAAVSVAVGLLLLRRPRGSHDGHSSMLGTSNAAQLRRLLLVLGVVIVLLVAAGVVMLLMLGEGDAAANVGTWWAAGGVGLLGLVLLLVGLPRLPAAVTSWERPEDDPAVAAADWVRLGTESWSATLLVLRQAAFGPPLLVGASLLPSLLSVAVHGSTWAAILVVAMFAVALVVLLVVARLRARPPWVARDGTAIRNGSKQVPASAIDAASLTVTPWVSGATERSLTIVLHAPGRFRTMVRLRRQGMLVLTAAQTTTLVELISRSAIELPRDEHDPKGRFSKALHPTHLTKAEALALVEQPPGDGAPLPIVMPGQT